MNIDFTESNKAIEKLKKLDLNSSDSEQEISYLIKNKINIPFINVIIPNGIKIYRARKNEKGEEFTTKDEISYNPFLDKISPGRANKKGQSIFYASHMLETTLFETSSLVKYETYGEREVFTVGRWHVKEPFLMVILIPKLFILDILGLQEKMLVDTFKGYKELIKNSTLFQDSNAKRHLEFFSDQFVRTSHGNENIYKISSEYFNHCIKFSKEKVYGMLYPIVDVSNQDLNIALLPEAADKFLILDMIVKYEITINGITDNIKPLGIGDIKKYEIK